MPPEIPSAPPPVRRRRRRWIFRGLLLLLSVGLVGAVVIHQRVRATGRERIYFDPDLVPPREVAVVLGTAPTIQGRSNLFFESRMNACAELWRRGKVRHFIVSGDNGRKTYDEPTAMRDALISRAVPASAITLDYAGFRTLDTMARAAAVFGQRKITVVTDDFHLPRALFLAEAHGLDAIGFGGKPVPVKYSRKTRTREVASRIAAWIDVNALHTKPRFFGPPVTVPVTAMSDK